MPSNHDRNPHERDKPPRKGPAGIDNAQLRPDAPPRGAVVRGKAAPPPKVTEPPLAQNAPVDLPKGVRREIDRVASDAKDAHRFHQHLTCALTALDQRDGRTAIPHLRYLKARLPRTGLLREALGVALYLEEHYDQALSELGAYRRLTGKPDHNHLVADALRATGHNCDRIPALIVEMENHNLQHDLDEGHPDDRVPDAAIYEGRIVWASWLADTGDIGAGRAVLAPLLNTTNDNDHDDSPDEHHLRAWYVAADLAQRDNDPNTARQLLQHITDNAHNFYDTNQRLTNLT